MMKSDKFFAIMTMLALALITYFLLSNPILASESSKLTVEKYIGSSYCKGCHPGQYNMWNRSLHSQMIRPLTYEILAEYGIDGPKSDPKSAAAHGITVDPKFPYIIGGKWKLKFINATKNPEDPGTWTVATWQYIVATGEREPYSPNKPVNWAEKCPQCHVTGFDSKTKTFYGAKIEESISCESFMVLLSR